VPRGHFDRSERKAATRARLLEAAGRVFTDRGFGAATLDEVAAEAGYTKGAVYAHFGSKENLLSALVAERLAATLTEQVDLFEAGEGATERPRAGGDSWMAKLRESPEGFRLMIELWVHAQRDPALAKEFAAKIDEARSTFANLVERTGEELFGAKPPREFSERVATIMLGLGNGLSLLKLADPAGVPDELLGFSLALLVDTLTQRPETAAALVERA
jgi:AcrR family transcriptional regulator